MKKTVSFITMLILALAIIIPTGIFIKPQSAIAASNDSVVGTYVVEHLTTVPEGYTGIYTKADLNAVRNDLSGNYILMNDIVFSDADFAPGGAFYNGGKGWEAIGDYLGYDSKYFFQTEAFTGIFDGNGYQIKNLYINNDSTYKEDEFLIEHTHCGLFKRVTGTVKNLGLVNGNITVKVTAPVSKVCAGSIAAVSTGTILNCYNTGSLTVVVTETNAQPEDYGWTGIDLGGVVGTSGGNIISCYNSGKITITSETGETNLASVIAMVGGITSCSQPDVVYSDDTTRSLNIVGCYNSGIINCNLNIKYNEREYGDDHRIGGIVSSVSNTLVDRCYNNNSISVSIAPKDNLNLGGVIGVLSLNSTCSNSYNDAGLTVSLNNDSKTNMGGISGNFEQTNKISNCYNSGDLLITSQGNNACVGGISGYVYDPDTVTNGIKNCYFLDNTNDGIGYLTNETFSSIVKLTVTQMKQQSSYVGFDFNSIWEFRSGYSYPQLRTKISAGSTPTIKPTATPTIKPSGTTTVKPTATPTIKPSSTTAVKPTATITATDKPSAKPSQEVIVRPTPDSMDTPIIELTQEIPTMTADPTIPPEEPDFNLSLPMEEREQGFIGAIVGMIRKIGGSTIVSFLLFGSILLAIVGLVLIFISKSKNKKNKKQSNKGEEK